MYPHERSLVKRFEKSPFALIGINSDRDRKKILEVIEEEEITWRSFWNGGSTRGPISTQWQVRGWPTIYVLDAKGVIRFKNVRGSAMEAAIIELLEEMGEEIPPELEEEKEKEDEKDEKSDGKGDDGESEKEAEKVEAADDSK